MRPTISLEKWLDATRHLLQLERDAEIAQSKLENDTLPTNLNPNVLLNLQLASASTGLFGRTVLVLKQGHNRELPSHHFGIGDLVQLSIPTASLTPAAADGFPKGIVTKVEDHAISVAFEDMEDADEYHNVALRLDKLVNDATYRKLHEGIDRLAKYSDGPAMNILNVVFHGGQPQTNPRQPLVTSAPMNPSQVEAIEYALASKDIALIHGPPGTGKTTTVVEFIAQCVTKHKMKVLVTAPSNIAVDNVLEKVAATKPKFRVTRIGHPARLLPQVLQYCLDARIAAAEGTAIIADIRKEMAQLQAKMAKARKQRAKTGVYELRKECQLLRKEVRDRERKVVREIIEHSDVIFATNAGAATKLLSDMVFDVVVIDEAAQALEASCWIPLLMGKRCVLAGDHLQLPPTIKSDAAARVHMTLFDRIAKMETTKGVVKMLSTQYRMHAAISDWSSAAMYDGKLASAEAVARRRLSDLPHVTTTTELTEPTLLLLDTAGCGLEEDVDDTTGPAAVLQLSKSNAGEADVVVAHVKALLGIGLRPSDVAVITPYNAQVQLLKRMLSAEHPAVEIRSVDGFQGCEKEAVVMSLVRSNVKKQVGFLADDRRMNVAITRAKRHVALVCDSDTISAHPFLKALVAHFEAHGDYRSADEYMATDASAFDTTQLLQEIQKQATAASAKSAADEAKAQLPTAKSAAPPTKQRSTPMSTASAKASKAKSPTPPATTTVAPPESTTTTTTPLNPSTKAPVAPVDAPESDADTDRGDDATSPVAKAASAFDALMGDSESSDSSEDDEDEAKPAPPPANTLLKDLHKERVARQKAAAPPPPPKKVKKKGMAKKPSAPVEGVAAQASGEDDLAYLDRVAATANVCASAKCKQSTSLMGSVCKFCRLKFCYSHAQPEVHGCGAAVRAFEQDRARLQTTAVKSNSFQAKERRKLLQKALDDKLTAKSGDRKPKQKPKT
ncbi:DNA polymerase alpha-associated DNA helicase A [Achlya hypogyna]|uniref:DNA helicase n=1 Tax=Achlya hypogyna TaxID=1202772 RepID=A0A1V9Z1I8_ACHHY|nr:DNA polymerase alpha-associated DNA helicase A [Achlya hypogyna]